MTGSAAILGWIIESQEGSHILLSNPASSDTRALIYQWRGEAKAKVSRVNLDVDTRGIIFWWMDDGRYPQ